MTSKPTNPLGIHHPQPFTVERWIEIFSKTPSPNSVEHDIAGRILCELDDYRPGGKYLHHDIGQLANAMIAYARLLQEHGVTV